MCKSRIQEDLTNVKKKSVRFLKVFQVYHWYQNIKQSLELSFMQESILAVKSNPWKPMMLQKLLLTDIRQLFNVTIAMTFCINPFLVFPVLDDYGYNWFNQIYSYKLHFLKFLLPCIITYEVCVGFWRRQHMPELL